MHNKIYFSDHFLLQKIIKQNLYCDKKSKDPFINNQEGPKYKLAGNCLLEHYFFHVLTRRKGACKQLCTLTIQLQDWKNRVQSLKMADIGYCDLTKFDRIERTLLLKKIKDKENGFPYVAKLSDQKYKELIKLKRYLYKHPKISKETRDIIKKGISRSYDPLLSKLGIG